ncbi:MAG: acylphosphatase [Methanoregula sp.]|nr:acylphosphatase [Methanoregula sp.]
MTVKMYDIMKMQASITGNPVQGVGYRVFLLQKALGYGIQRFDARNEMSHEKQQVIVRAEGEPAMIEEFCSFILTESPPSAIISDISFQEYTGYVISIIDYMHLVQVEQLSKGIPAIISIDKKQDRMLDKQDQMLDKQDQMIQKMDHMESSITGEIKDLRTDLRSYMDRKFSVMEQDIQQIKVKIGLM